MDFDSDDLFDLDPNLLPDFDSCDFFASAAPTSSLPSSLPTSSTQPMVSTRHANKRKCNAAKDKSAKRKAANNDKSAKSKAAKDKAAKNKPAKPKTAKGKPAKPKAAKEKPAHNPKTKVPIQSSTAEDTHSLNLGRYKRLAFIKTLKPPNSPSQTTDPIDKDDVSVEGNSFLFLTNSFLITLLSPNQYFQGISGVEALDNEQVSPEGNHTCLIL